MLSSCSDYLTTLPTDSLVSDGAISTPEDTKTALNGAYAGLIAVESNYYYGTDFLARAEVGGEDAQTNKVGDRTENLLSFLLTVRITLRKICGILLIPLSIE